jgi:hypothetical protein
MASALKPGRYVYTLASIYYAERTYSSKDAPTNPRGIPVAPFVDRVEDYVTDRSEVENTINSFKEMISYGAYTIILLVHIAYGL